MWEDDKKKMHEFRLLPLTCILHVIEQPVQHSGRVCALHAEGPRLKPGPVDMTNKVFVFCSCDCMGPINKAG